MSIFKPQISQNGPKWDKVTKFILFLLIFSIFFPTRHVFFTKSAYLTGQFSDFTAISLYSSDILLILLVLIVFMAGKSRELFQSLTSNLQLLIIWLILAFLLSTSFKQATSWWYLAKVLELIVAYGTMSVLFKKGLSESPSPFGGGLGRGFLKIFALFSSLEAILALFQFINQSPLGLFLIGEQHLDRFTPGFAKLIVNGVPYLRGYGTFPHPNPLSAFLVAGILIITYLLANSASRSQKVILSSILFLNILGLTVTFSRGAYLALALGLIVFFGFLFFPLLPLGEGARRADEGSRGRTVIVMVIVLISSIASILIFRPFLLTRATFSDQSTIDRVYYDKLGLKMIKKHPIFGIGLGESVIQSSDYSNKPLAPWEKQPPHNYFLLAAAEMGIFGALILLWIFLKHLWNLFTLRLVHHSFNDGGSLGEVGLLTTILISFLALMQFDHYFYTLEQTQLLIWVTLGIISAQKNSPPFQRRG